MTATSRLYDAMNDFLSQCDTPWRDVRHLKTLCWTMVGMIESQNVHLNGFEVYINSRAQIAQSHQRRFRRWLSNRRTDMGFQSLTEAIESTSPAGRMMMQMVGAFAEFERAMLRKRTCNGLNAAQKEGRVGGRRPKLKAH